MFKYTKHQLKKIEELFKELKYTIRYEKGNFQSGYCIVENRNIAVVNKFFDTEARINCLLEIMGTVEIDKTTLTESSQAFYEKLNKSLAEREKEVEESADEAEVVTEAEKTEKA